jgi:hypothetical protein
MTGRPGEDPRYAHGREGQVIGAALARSHEIVTAFFAEET